MARRTRGGKGHPGLERWLPLGYLGLAIAIVALVLPSALRPPPQQQNQTAQLSPNSPQDKRLALYAFLHAASSGSAGAGVGNAALPPVSTTTTLPPTGSNVTLQANYCPFGVDGRQTPDVYSPPCAPAWHGNNGGATWKGVTPTQINVSYEGPSPNGPGSETVTPADSAAMRTLKVFERYFNEAFQLWGRHIQFYVGTATSTMPSDETNQAVTDDQQYHIFEAAGTSEPGCQYFSQHKIISWCGILEPQDWYSQGTPPQMMYGWVMNGTENSQYTAEYICKQLVGRDAVYAGEADYQHKVRKFGLLTYDTRGYAPLAAQMSDALKRTCGVTLDVQYSQLDNSNGEAALAQAATKFKADGVTTVIPDTDFLSADVFTSAAASNDWFPEWLVNGGGGEDRNGIAQGNNQQEWAHAFGYSIEEMERPVESSDCYRSYQMIDPSNTPDYNFCAYDYTTLYMAIAALQLAGPDLTPTSVQNGLYGLGLRYPTHPVWALGGGIGPGHPTYGDSIAFIWYNANAADPTSTSTGAYEYMNGGQRYRLGSLPIGAPDDFGSNGTTIVPDSNDPGPT